MPLKKYNPITPAQRGLQLIDRKDLFKGRPWESLTRINPSSAGRNNHGRMTVRGRGSGHKRRMRIIDFKRRELLNVTAEVERIEYDPGRSAFIALLNYGDESLEHKGRRYILAPQKLKVGDKVLSSDAAIEIKPGNAMPLAIIAIGTLVHNVELKPGKGGQMARSAGQYAQIVGRDNQYVLLRISSGEIRRVLGTCFATCGSVSNPDNSNQNLAKAGRRRWMGWRPKVRGVAKNPVDHPMGGGEGKSSGGRHPTTPWGKPTKGYRTRKNHTSDRLIVRSRHKRK